MYRLSKLLALNRQIFHTQDLAVAWGITNTNTLYVTISRLVRAGVLFPVQKGLYSTVLLTRLDPYVLGTALAHGYAYVSCETVLAEHGLIAQQPSHITFVSSVSASIEKAGHRFRYRKLTDRFLYQSAGIEKRGDVLWATVPRAVSDLLYYVPRYHIDGRPIINWDHVRAIRKEVGYI